MEEQVDLTTAILIIFIVVAMVLFLSSLLPILVVLVLIGAVEVGMSMVYIIAAAIIAFAATTAVVLRGFLETYRRFVHD